MTEPTLFDEQKACGARRDYPAAWDAAFYSVADQKRSPLTPQDRRWQIRAMLDEIDQLRARIAELETRVDTRAEQGQQVDLRTQTSAPAAAQTAPERDRKNGTSQ